MDDCSASFKVCIIGSREQLCIHPQVTKETNNTTKVYIYIYIYPHVFDHVFVSLLYSTQKDRKWASEYFPGMVSPALPLMEGC